MSYIDWDDVVKKLVPSKIRFTWHLDWLYTQIKGIKDIHTETTNLTNVLDIKSDYNIAVNMIEKRLNDIFDIHHREIYTVQINYDGGGNTDGFTVKVPTYLQYGDIEERMSAVIDYYLMAGVTYSYSYFTASFTHDVKTYIDALSSPSDTEIWTIINFYNRIRGHGFYSSITKFHLMSPTSEANSLVRFIGSSNLVEIPNGGGIDWDRKGFASDGLAVLGTGFIPNTHLADISNNTTILYMSEIIEDGVNDLVVQVGGISDAISVHAGGDLGTFSLGSAGIVFPNVFPSLDKITYMRVLVSGSGQMYKDTIAVGNPITIVSTTKNTIEKYLCGGNNSGVVNFPSKNRVGTWGEIDIGLSKAQRLILNNAVLEYNNLNSR